MTNEEKEINRLREACRKLTFALQEIDILVCPKNEMNTTPFSVDYIEDDVVARVKQRIENSILKSDVEHHYLLSGPTLP